MTEKFKLNKEIAEKLSEFTELYKCKKFKSHQHMLTSKKENLMQESAVQELMSIHMQNYLSRIKSCLNLGDYDDKSKDIEDSIKDIFGVNILDDLRKINFNRFFIKAKDDIVESFVKLIFENRLLKEKLRMI
jgi:hypothetical protein